MKMKKSVIVLLFMYIQNTNSQISITKAAEYKPNTTLNYDSLTNFLGNDCMNYKGQELFVLPKRVSLREYGYEGFTIDYKLRNKDNENVYKCCDGNNSKYNELQSRTFAVLDVIYYDENPYQCYLKIHQKGTNDTLYYVYDKKYKNQFPFLVNGYLEKQKSIFINNQVLIRNFPKIPNFNQKKTLDIKSGVEIEFKKGEYLKCLDITINEEDYEPSLLLENSKGQTFLFGLYTRFLNISRILTKAEAEGYLIKYGNENWETILDEDVKIGFTEEMVVVSWGKPKTINKSSSRDQWVYPNRYLYFENGKLVSFN